MFSRDQLKRAASLTEEDFAQLGKCRRPLRDVAAAGRPGITGLALATR